MTLGTWTVVLEADRVDEDDVVGYRFYSGSVAQPPDVPQSAGNPQKTMVLESVESTIPVATFGVTAVDNGGLESLRTDLSVRLDADAPTKPGALRLVSAVFVPAG
ncbi:MAG TPA: hypothetical protein VJ777_10925 [Mycobacterium sp.]|nr:hypothetical protein [Mycobacterium sp.]